VALLKRYLNGLLDLEQLGRLLRKRLAPFHGWVDTGFPRPRTRELRRPIV
jgi:hypothetical protein